MTFSVTPGFPRVLTVKHTGRLIVPKIVAGREMEELLHK